MKRFMQQVTLLRRLTTAQEGSAMPFIAMGIFMLTGATGIAIDMGRLQIVQSRMQNALDAAGLAVGSQISTANIQAETRKYFYANFPASYLGTTIIGGPDATPNTGNTLITLSVNGTVDMTFMRLFGRTSMPVSARSEITRQSKGMELVLVMDVTGSMSNTAGGGISKLNAAKQAVQALLTTLYGPNETLPNFYVGVVPFSQAVNVGPTRTDWLSNSYASMNWGTTSWAGCVESRANGTATPRPDISDDPPSVRPFPAYYSPCNTNTSYEDNRWYGTNTNRDNCATTGGTLRYKTGLGANLGPNLYCPVEVLPMVREKTTIQNKVNSFTAVGNTHINIGMAWGWRMLSPRWRGLWGGQMNSNNLPLDYNTALMNKVVILMTDGDNTLSGTNAASTATATAGLYSAYGFPNANQLSVSGGSCTSGGSCSAGVNEMNARTATVCNSMKSNGVIIYTIALGTGIGTTAQNMLRNCATSPSYYFLSPSTTQLTGIFRQIGDSLANLRISQ